MAPVQKEKFRCFVVLNTTCHTKFTIAMNVKSLKIRYFGYTQIYEMLRSTL